MRQHFWLISLIVCLTIGGCGGKALSTTAKQTTSEPPTNQPPPQTQTIPADVAYSIVDSDTIPGVKRSLDIRLSKKVSEAILSAIAIELKVRDSRHYARTFMAYYLPEMAVGAGAWATTDFDPELKVRILGLSEEEERKLVAEPVPANSKVLGRWLDERPYVGSRLTIFRDPKALLIVMEIRFKDGGSLREELIERKSPRGRRFDIANGSRHGEYWVIEATGNLQAFDTDGIVATFRKVE